TRTETYNVAFVERLRELGFVEGRNLVIEFRSAEGRIDRLRELAADLARGNFDVLLAFGSQSNLAALEQASRDMPIVMIAADYDPAFAEFVQAKAGAVLALASGLFVPARRLIPELALKHRLPSMFNNYLWAEAGGLLTYGVSFPDLWRRAADKVALVLQGAKP